MGGPYITYFSSPIGILSISGTADHITEITFRDIPADGRTANHVTLQAAKEIEEYFAGTRRQFEFPAQQSGTDFQMDVWKRLGNLPYGETVSYTRFSAHNPLAIRAISAANGRNNIAIAVPCHRVIGSSGKLVGYAGGLWRKKWLLQHEKMVLGIGQTELSL